MRLGFLPILVVNLVLSGPVGHADTTLVFGLAGSDGKAGAPSHQIHVKGGKVSVANAADKRLLVFDAAKESAMVVDHAAKQVTELNRDSVEFLTEGILEARRRFLSDLEDRLRSEPKEDRERLRDLMDRLHRATEEQGFPSRFDLTFELTGKSESRLGVSAGIAEVSEGNIKWGTAALADPEGLRISSEDLAALKSFQNFFDELTKGLPGNLRAQFGEVLILSPEDQIFMSIEKSATTANGEVATTFQMNLLHFDHDEVEDGWFEAPADFQRMSLYPVPKAEREGGTKAEDTSVK
ncbi:MAG: hypothetical protein KDN19_14335 [Verrucomicrobiae bacterium]|nr:hypothetical protein [Verrucomicrobiae bacterium]